MAISGSTTRTQEALATYLGPPISLPSPAPGPSGRPSPPRSASERPARALGTSARWARNPLLGLGRQTETPAPAGAVNADGGSGGREDRDRRRLGGPWISRSRTFSSLSQAP